MTLSNAHPNRQDYAPHPLNDPILRLPEVERQTGLKKTHIYALVRKSKFPTPIKLGERASGWLSSEIRQWIQDRIAVSRSRFPPPPK
ncbi:helix-turn-helix transcriptional regulator [Microbulbifer spongiae]|uniref:AlpA family transcriptional regulator n=1 Tax=Microbulbifer spongiae TaxID=2944933 RepID=A0ABY9EBW3_9GAMM|nr:AlpA family transcriptional regulator [Microbulbifer sp. MI-G]WKD50513.1 AlpA family transcriptional regulator [Microbulbifer sp. MI-G]